MNSLPKHCVCERETERERERRGGEQCEHKLTASVLKQDTHPKGVGESGSVGNDNSSTLSNTPDTTTETV